MFRNALVTIGFLWFSLAPTLCAAGVLTHDCDSFISFECESSCVDIEPDCCEHSHSHDGCSHDNGSHDACANDPCQVQVVVQGVRDKGFHSSSHDALAAPDSVLNDQLSTLRTRSHVDLSRRSAGKNLPYPPSDMPLRA